MNEEAKVTAMKEIGKSLQLLNEEEKLYLKELREQIDKAVKTDPGLDKQLEFCYGIIFAPDRIKNEKLIKSARDYINAVEG